MQQPATIIAILGADTVVGRALSLLLEGHGYRINPLDAHPSGVADELLKGAALLLLAPRQASQRTATAYRAYVGPYTHEVPRTP